MVTSGNASIVASMASWLMDVWTASGLHAADALPRQRSGSHQELGVLVGVDVVGDDGDAVMLPHPLTQTVE